MAASLVSLHVASNAKRLSAARLRTLERLFSSMAVVVDLETAWPRECFVASRTDITIL